MVAWPLGPCRQWFSVSSKRQAGPKLMGSRLPAGSLYQVLGPNEGGIPLTAAEMRNLPRGEGGCSSSAGEGVHEVQLMMGPAGIEGPQAD